MVRGEPPGSKGVSLGDGIPSSASAEAWARDDWFSPADFVGEANRLSGRWCVKLISCRTEEENINR